ncbi:hypothetical protein GCM10018775_42240 [Streptomyces umbrinus]|nr:hypothetical protein GCM10018775_42240 [Streptomyces umbrinus]
MWSALAGAHTVTRTPRATSPDVSDRTWAQLPALPPPSTWTVRSGDCPGGEWLLTWITWPGLLVRRRAVTKKLQKERAVGVYRSGSSSKDARARGSYGPSRGWGGGGWRAGEANSHSHE